MKILVLESGIKFLALVVSVWRTEAYKGNLSEDAYPDLKVLRES